MLSNLSNPLWWKDAALRATYTALAIALPYLGAATLNAVPWLTVALAAALGFVTSLLTSLAGLPEVEGVHLPWWLAAVERVVKTFAQSLVAGFVGATLITDVDWAFVLQAAALAALTSLVRLILATLPADPTRGDSTRLSGTMRVQGSGVTVQEPVTLIDPHNPGNFDRPGAHNQP